MLLLILAQSLKIKVGNVVEVVTVAAREPCGDVLVGSSSVSASGGMSSGCS